MPPPSAYTSAFASMVLVASLPDLGPLAEWKLPSGGAHGLDIDHSRGRLYAACDDGALVEIDSISGGITNVWRYLTGSM
jgi:hypothetical protein